jgi:hypothetical protein
MNPLFLIVPFLSSVFSTSSVSNCGKNPLFTITSLTLTPSTTAKTNENVSLGLTYTSPTTIQNGTVVTSITYNFIPFSPSTALLCASAPCPLVPGEHDGSSWYLMPSGLAGTIVTMIEWYSDTGLELLCIKMTLKAKALSKAISLRYGY